MVDIKEQIRGSQTIYTIAESIEYGSDSISSMQISRRWLERGLDALERAQLLLSRIQLESMETMQKYEVIQIK